MDKKTLIRIFLKRLKEDGRSMVWFRKTYVPHIKYSTLTNQLYGYTEILHKDVEAGIITYLEIS